MQKLMMTSYKRKIIEGIIKLQYKYVYIYIYIRIYIVGRAERMIVVAGDNASSDNLMPWLGNGFRYIHIYIDICICIYIYM
jgi:hypothetical protein